MKQNLEIINYPVWQQWKNNRNFKKWTLKYIQMLLQCIFLPFTYHPISLLSSMVNFHKNLLSSSICLNTGIPINISSFSTPRNSDILPPTWVICSFLDFKLYIEDFKICPVFNTFTYFFIRLIHFDHFWNLKLNIWKRLTFFTVHYLSNLMHHYHWPYQPLLFTILKTVCYLMFLSLHPTSIRKPS